MGAIVNHSTVGEAAVRSLQAGVDMLLVCKSRRLATDTIKAVCCAIESSVLDKSLLEASLARIASVKEQFVSPYYPIDIPSIPDTVGISAHHQVLAQVKDQFPTWT
jgi:beta-N-acetylhexosaminidase